MAKRKPRSQPVDGGTPGDDLLSTDGRAGTIDGGAGFDTLRILLGSASEDVIMAGTVGTGSAASLSTGLVLRNIESLVILTGSGNDSLFGGSANDFFFTTLGNDRAAGGGGSDTFDLGAGANIATGGAGGDRFELFDGGVTTVTDFDVAEGDRLSFFFDIVDISSAQAIADGRLRFADSAGGALVQIDQNGAVDGFAYHTIAIVAGVEAANLSAEAFIG